MPTAVLQRPPGTGEVATVPNGGEITNAELARRLDSFSRDVHADLAQIMHRLDAYVLREVYASDQTRREDQVQALRRELAEEKIGRKRDLEQLRGQVRWWWTAVVVPVGALVINIIRQGGG